MKLLYIDHIHHYLSADDCLTWSKLGIEWYSTGFYRFVNGIGDLPQIPTFFSNPKIRDYLDKCLKSQSQLNKIVKDRVLSFTEKEIYDEWILTDKLVEQFDVFVFNHNIFNVLNNLEIIGNKPIIFKTFGMALEADEVKIGVLRALKKIIRVSNSESEKLRCPNYAGNDYVIHNSFIPDENIISGWSGNKQQVCTFSNVFHSDKVRRGHYINIKQKCPKYDFLLFGSGDEKEPLSNGFVKMSTKIDIMKHSRVHLVTGTPNSACTYSLIESMVVGAPVVCYGQNMWQSKSYEPNKVFNHGEDLLIGETSQECSDYINLLMEDDSICRYLGKNARKKALSIYGRDIVVEKWRELFKNIGFNL